jgi:hypothetical protein
MKHTLLFTLAGRRAAEASRAPVTHACEARHHILHVTPSSNPPAPARKKTRTYGGSAMWNEHEAKWTATISRRCENDNETVRE